MGLEGAFAPPDRKDALLVEFRVAVARLQKS
jgi:hypothetical protein